MTKRLYGLIVLLIVLLGVTAWHSIRLSQLEQDAHPLVDIMGNYLRFADKIHLSGDSGNWELASWYAWKLTKQTWPVKDGKVLEYQAVEAYDIAELTEQMLDPAVESLNKAIEAKDKALFENASQALRNACNACHIATQHPYVRVVVPDRNAYPGQDFQPPTQTETTRD